MADTKTEKKEVTPGKQDYSNLNLYQKLAAITGEVGSIAKGGTNKEQGYAFIEYGAVAGELRTLFAKYNVMVIPIMKTDTRKIEEVTTRNGRSGYHVVQDFDFKFINCDKPEETEVIPWSGEAIDYGDKAINKTATGALKYCLMRTFNISEKGDDPDETSPERGDAPEAAPPAPHRKLTIQDAIAKASAGLVSRGFKEAEERKRVMLKIAGVQKASDLTPQLVVHVLEVIESISGAELRGYLDAEEVEQAEVIDQAADAANRAKDPLDH